MKQASSFLLTMMLSFGLSTVQLGSQSTNSVEINDDFSSIELRPFLSYTKAEAGLSVESPIDLINHEFLPLSEQKGILKGSTVWLKFTVDKNLSEDLILVSRLTNYANVFTVFYQNASTEWQEKEYTYDTPIKDREFQVGEGVISIPTPGGDQTIYIKIDVKYWMIKDWVLYSQAGYAQHKSISTFLLNTYIVVFIIFFCFAVIGSIVFKNQLSALFSMYCLSMGLYILFESNWLSEYIFFDEPGITIRWSQFIMGLLFLIVLLYAREIIKYEQYPNWLRIIFRIFIFLTLLFMFSGFVLKGHSLVIDVLSYAIAYGATVVLLISAILNIKSSVPMRWMIAGLVIMVIAGTLIDLHAQNIIFMPSSIYILIPALLSDLLCVGIGTIIAAKLEVSKLKKTKSNNELLKSDVDRLKREVSHSLAAYETIVNRSATGDLNVPDEYLEHPLSAREYQILQLLNDHYSNRQIADELHLSRNTIKTHLKNIYQKLNAKTREESVKNAKDYGLL